MYVFQTWMFMNLWCTTFYGVENCFCYGLVLFFNLALKLKVLWPFIIFSQVMQSLVIVTQYFLSFCITKAVTEHTIFFAILSSTSRDIILAKVEYTLLLGTDYRHPERERESFFQKSQAFGLRADILDWNFFEAFGVFSAGLLVPYKKLNLYIQLPNIYSVVRFEFGS